MQREVVSIALSFWGHTTVAFGAASYRMDGDKMFWIEAQEGFLFVVFKVFLRAFEGKPPTFLDVTISATGGFVFVFVFLFFRI